MYAAFAVGQEWTSGVLLDSDAEGETARKKLQEMRLKELANDQKEKFFIVMLGKAAGIEKNDAAIEDLFDDQFYLDCVNAAFGFAIKFDDLPVDGSDMISKRIEVVMKDRFGRQSLDKRQVMKEMLRRFDKWNAVSDLPPDTVERAERLFDTRWCTLTSGNSVCAPDGCATLPASG